MIHSADPFDFWIIDDFLPTDMAQAAADHFFEGVGAWTKRHHLYSRYKETRTSGLSHQVEDALQALECPGMLAYVSAITGVTGLHADRMRYGGGQHVTWQGGSLGIHADFTHHPQSGMRRALNLLLYLSDGESGALELWDAQVQQRKALVLTQFNRAIIFKTSVSSFHGHPEPLQESKRLSLACYYYVRDCCVPDATKPTGYDTSYLKTTDYRPRPWEYGLRLRKWLSTHIKGGSR